MSRIILVMLDEGLCVTEFTGRMEYLRHRNLLLCKRLICICSNVKRFTGTTRPLFVDRWKMCWLPSGVKFIHSSPSNPGITAARKRKQMFMDVGKFVTNNSFDFNFGTMYYGLFVRSVHSEVVLGTSNGKKNLHILLPTQRMKEILKTFNSFDQHINFTVRKKRGQHCTFLWHKSDKW